MAGLNPATPNGTALPVMAGRDPAIPARTPPSWPGSTRPSPHALHRHGRARPGHPRTHSTVMAGLDPAIPTGTQPHA